MHGLKQDLKRGAKENFTKAELDALWKEWLGDECPRGKGGTSGRGGGSRGGGGFGGGCFVEQTQVLTSNGMQPIETISVGDIVLSRNENSGINEYKRVLEVFQLESHELMELIFGKSAVKVTTIHRFFVETKGWTEAADLKVGDVLLSQDGKRVILTKTTRYKFDKPVRVYNFGVEDNHNYFVSNDTVLVHNLKLVETYLVIQAHTNVLKMIL